MLHKFLNPLLDLLFPLFCISCGKGTTVLCDTCYASIPFKGTLIRNPCEDLDFGIVCSNYENAILKKAIKQYKYQGIHVLADPLSKLMRRGCAVLPLSTATIMPIPLHRRKEKMRGFNQSLLLAEKIATAMNLPLDQDLRRTAATRSQSTLSREQRLKNVVGIFRYAGEAPKNVILIDDIATTFATLSSAARELKKHNARMVGALVLAKNEIN